MILILANLFPVYGVIFLKWDVFPLLLLFWIENVIIGFFNIFRMIFAVPEESSNWIGKLFVIPFFTFHYGMFTAVHGIFVIALFGGESFRSSGFPGINTVFQIVVEYHLGFIILILFLSHGFSFLWNYIKKGEYRNATLKNLMGKPYGRVVVLHITILFGGFILMALKSPVAGLLLLILLKIGLDVKAHSKDHKLDH